MQDVELAYELPDAYFHIQTCDDGYDYTLYNKDFTERDGGILDLTFCRIATELCQQFRHSLLHSLISIRFKDAAISFCIEENGGFVGMYELVVNDKVQRENINSINYFRDDKLVQQAISDMEKLMAARQQGKEQERGSTKKSVLDALRSLKAKKQEQPAQEQDKPKKAKKKGMEL